MGFKITKVFCGGEELRKGKEYGNYKGGKKLFRTLDDDGNICYHALCDGDKSAEHFHDFSTADVGATCSEYREDGKWKGFIS